MATEHDPASPWLALLALAGFVLVEVAVWVTSQAEEAVIVGGLGIALVFRWVAMPREIPDLSLLGVLGGTVVTMFVGGLTTGVLAMCGVEGSGPPTIGLLTGLLAGFYADSWFRASDV